MLLSLSFLLFQVPTVPEPRIQSVTLLQVEHRAGQSFLTWRESMVAAAGYRIYRSVNPIQQPSDLNSADFLGEVDHTSSFNSRRSQVEGVNRNWIIEPGGSELDDLQGLFVYTVEADGDAFYAVTTVDLGGNENTQISPGDNATIPPIAEFASEPVPVLQGSVVHNGFTVETWAHWVSDRDTPFQNRFTLLPSSGFNFRIRKANSGITQGFILRCHARGGVYAGGWPGDNALPADMNILSPDDPFPVVDNSFWFGSHDEFPDMADSNNIVLTFSLDRLEWTFDWTWDYLGALVDHDRIYAMGTSMGAVAAMRVVESRPELFAAVLCRNGLYDFTTPDSQQTNVYQHLYGNFALDLPSDLGLPVYDRLNSAFMAALNPMEDWPPIRTLHGKNDTVVGWMPVPALMDALKQARRPDAHYFDQRNHGAEGYWQPLEPALIARTLEHRLNVPILRLVDLSMNDDPGNGLPHEGADEGCVNGYADYERHTVLATATSLRYFLSLRDEGTMDDAPVDFATARLVPRRTGVFQPIPNNLVHFELNENNQVVDEHLVVVDANGWVETPATPLTDSRRRATFSTWTAPFLPYLFVGEAPLPNDDLQVVVLGGAGETYEVRWSDNPLGPFVPLFIGSLDGDGRANHFHTLANDPGLSGTSLYFRVIVDGISAPEVVITIQ